MDKGDERRADLPKTDCKSKLRLDVELVCQAGTKSHDPFWDGPRLAPAFVTQLLGQVMDKERNGLVRRPYETLAGKSAALLDESF